MFSVRRSALLSALLLAVVLATGAAEGEQAEPPSAEAAPEAPAVDDAELKEARSQIEQLKQAAESTAAELLGMTEKSQQHQDKAEAFKKQLEKAESTANKYLEQTTNLNKENQDLRKEITAQKKELGEWEDKFAAAQEGIAQAENQEKAIRDQIQSEFAAKLKSAEEATQDAEARLEKSQKETQALQALLNSADVQTYFQMRDMAAQGAEYTSQKTSELLEAASEYTDSASSVLAENYDDAWSKAHKLAEDASPMAEDLHKQVMEQGTPLIVQASDAMKQGMDASVKAVRELLESVDATKPYAHDASWWIVVGVAGLPLMLIALFFFKIFISLCSKFLFKMQYAGVFFMVGAVLTTHSLAVATNTDPISQLRVKEPALDAAGHAILSVIAVALSGLHFVTLLVKDNGGKTMMPQLCSMIAAVLVVVVFSHYYFLVYLKRTDPKFAIKLDYSSNGDPSYVEYSLFFVALGFFTTLGLPPQFRDSARALYTGIESGFAGALAALCFFGAVDSDAFGHVFSSEYFKMTVTALAGLLVLVLGYRTVSKMAHGVISGLFAFVHFGIVCRICLVVKQMADNHKPVGSNLKYATAGFLFVSLVHLVWMTFGKEGAKSEQSKPRADKSTAGASSGKGKGQAHSGKKNSNKK